MERLSPPPSRNQARGLLVIHSLPSALRRHVDWAIQSVLGNHVELEWKSQPLIAGTYRSTVEWRDVTGRASEIASSLRTWHYIHFEVQEFGDNGGEIFRFTPELGIHRGVTDAAGAIQISEFSVTHLLDTSFDEESLRQGLALILGTSWEFELERFRGVDLQEVSHLRAI
ncbi:MAG: DUF3145 family protein [Actinobacteria bacterium]|uniref:Unannotated protein n=1 Tax=freshwater metagenome TaxID=449393 RepID=A0A6J6M595_9ZZZZ|nr:DUF3145 family protein [Actinomycetota bacterium]MTA19891.1 DUF3145 family protein [Actinomycetota bacterium]